MNIYDKNIVKCIKCGKCIGEIDYDAEITYPKCSRCINMLPEKDNMLSYMYA